MRGPNVGEPSSRRAMPPPGTLSTPTLTFGSIEMNTVPTMLPSDWPTKRDARTVEIGAGADSASTGSRARARTDRPTPWRRLSREVSRLERLMNQLPEGSMVAVRTRRAGVVVLQIQIERAFRVRRALRTACCRHRTDCVVSVMPCSGRSIATTAKPCAASVPAIANTSVRLRVMPCWKITTGQPAAGLVLPECEFGSVRTSGIGLRRGRDRERIAIGQVGRGRIKPEARALRNVCARCGLPEFVQRRERIVGVRRAEVVRHADHADIDVGDRRQSRRRDRPRVSPVGASCDGAGSDCSTTASTACSTTTSSTASSRPMKARSIRAPRPLKRPRLPAN